MGLSATSAKLKTDISALPTGQETLNVDIYVEMKSDMCSIRADFMTQMHAFEVKMDSCMAAITEKLGTRIGALCSVQSVLELGWISNKNCHQFSETTVPEPAGEIGGQVSSRGSSVQTFGWRRSSNKHHYS